ncbi:9620_t:CDS:2 [Paraglomus occultum]|uniref:9620_t:CDS:1 n=1 Tax=Paraglomus occultum TaxID=144539 RepID=A0A9N9AC52_9GLOM|nr:9620_t:CDS:2 [Paraglomus occultum]
MSFRISPTSSVDNFDYENTDSEASSTHSVASLFDPIKEAAMTPFNLFDQFIEIDGRYYFNDKELKTYLPSDRQEHARTRVQLYVYKLLWGGHFSSPITEELALGINVLDVGCGGGSWISAMATNFPLSSFVGIDISPLFPEDNPPNSAFIKCDVHDGLPFPSNSFDFIFQGFLVVSIDWQSWSEKVIKELIRVTKPGGYIEIMDMDAEAMNPGEIGRKYNHIMSTKFADAGINTMSSSGVVKAFGEHKREVTVEAVRKKKYYLGKHGGKLGEMALACYIQALESMGAFIGPLFDVTEDGYKQLLTDYYDELNNCNSFMTCYRIIVKKK